MDLLHVPPSSHCRSTLDMTLPVSFDFFVSFLSVSRTQFWFYTCLDIISFLSLQTSRLGPLEPLFLKDIIQTTFSLSPLSFCISLSLKCWSDGMFLFFRKHQFYITFFFSTLFIISTPPHLPSTQNLLYLSHYVHPDDYGSDCVDDDCC